MRVNKVEISKVLNKPPVAMKKALNNKKERKKKPRLKKVVNNIPPISAIYKTIYIDERFVNLIAISFKNMLPIQFFELCISTEYLKMIT